MYLKDYTQVNDDYYNVSYPLFKKEFITYRRQEKAGYTSNYSKNAPILREILINKSADILLGLCNGERTPDDICDEAMQIFNGVSKEVLQRDLKMLLFQYAQAGLVQWEKGGNPFMQKYTERLDDQHTITLANENELLKIKEFCLMKDKDNEIKYIAPTKRVQQYTNEITLREKLFSCAEEFVFIKKGEEIVGLITIAIPTIQISTVSSIGYIKMPKEFLGQAVKWIARNMKDIAVVDISKIKLQVLEGNHSIDEVINCFTDNGFEKEAVLKHECSNKDVTVYSKIY